MTYVVTGEGYEHTVIYGVMTTQAEAERLAEMLVDDFHARFFDSALCSIDSRLLIRAWDGPKCMGEVARWEFNDLAQSFEERHEQPPTREKFFLERVEPVEMEVWGRNERVAKLWDERGGA